MSDYDIFLALIFVFLWGVTGFNGGRILRRYYREEKLNWPNGKRDYIVDWIFSMIWSIGVAFLLGKLKNIGAFEDFELFGPLVAIIIFGWSIYYFRQR